MAQLGRGARASPQEWSQTISVEESPPEKGPLTIVNRRARCNDEEEREEKYILTGIL